MSGDCCRRKVTFSDFFNRFASTAAIPRVLTRTQLRHSYSEAAYSRLPYHPPKPKPKAHA